MILIRLLLLRSFSSLLFPNSGIQNPLPSQTSQANTLSFNQTDYDELIEYLQSQLQEKKSLDCGAQHDSAQMGINSLEGISPSDILALHTIYYRRIKQM